MQFVQVKKELHGNILDIGGGGDGIIGRVYGQSVTAIDNMQEELDESPNNCRKMLMDASSLSFNNETFDNVTFFFSLMYMDASTQEKAISEAVRVTKNGGYIAIWDTVIESAYPDPFIVELCIDADGEEVQTTYGILQMDAHQNHKTFISICEKFGLSLKLETVSNNLFNLTFQKL